MLLPGDGYMVPYPRAVLGDIPRFVFSLFSYMGLMPQFILIIYRKKYRKMTRMITGMEKNMAAGTGSFGYSILSR